MMVPELERPRVTEINVRIDCNGCVQKIKRALTGINGIYDFYLDIPQQKITVIGWADPERIMKAIKKVRKIATICSHNEASSDPNCSQPPPPDGGGPPQDGGQQGMGMGMTPPQDGGQQGMGMGMGNVPPPDPQSSNNPNYQPQQYENQPQQCENPPPPQETQNPQPQQYENPSHQNPQQYENPSNQNPQQYDNPSNQNPQQYENPSNSPPQQEPQNHQPQQYENPSNQNQEGRFTLHPAAYSSREGYGYGYGYDPRYRHEPQYHPSYHEPPPHYAYHEPPSQPYVIHNYNRYKPSPYITEYQYVGAPPPPVPVPYTSYGRTDHYYVDSCQNGSTSNGNVASMFSDENPNACTIV